MAKNSVQPKAVVDVLNRILEAELAGVVRLHTFFIPRFRA